MNAHQIEVLGAQIVQELGADPGLTPQYGINAAAELLSRGIATHQAQQEAKKTAEAQKVALARSLSADISWANSELMVSSAQIAKDPQKIAAAQALAANAEGNAATAAAALNAEGAAERLRKANEMAQQALERSLATPGNPALADAARAWSKVAAAARQSGGGGALALFKGGGGGFMEAMRKRYLGVPLGGWLIGVPVGVGAITLIVKALRRRK